MIRHVEVRARSNGAERDQLSLRVALGLIDRTPKHERDWGGNWRKTKIGGGKEAHDQMIGRFLSLFVVCTVCAWNQNHNNTSRCFDGAVKPQWFVFEILIRTTAKWCPINSVDWYRLQGHN